MENAIEEISDKFHEILRRPIKERRNLSPEDVRTLTLVELKYQGWSPSKAIETMEVMQIALRKVQENKQ